MEQLTLKKINNDVLEPMREPGALYWIFLLVTAGLAGWGALNWTYQVRVGMGVAGVNHPVGWGSYIANFVFWVGIAHSGTLISAILLLVRARWRTSVSRSAEAMTIFAIATAGMFPLIHLGRLWVFYYILPYPSQRQLWPNFQSPLVWDVVAIGTYFTVSLIFFYVGLLPDLAAARDRFEERLGAGNIRTRFYKNLALGWCGNSLQWHHHGRAYLYFATLATPLVVSVHSVVSWDFAVSLLPGWHVTLYAPYFVAGAIHSGLAMVLVLLIPMRKLLHLENLIQPVHFEALALTMLVTTGIMGYSYIAEPFTDWYSNGVFDKQFSVWRAAGPLAWIYWLLIPLNVLAPLSFAFKKVRTNTFWLFAMAMMVITGMWLERLMIVIGATWHDFLPHNWGAYWPTIVEVNIFLGALGFFLFCFMAFSRLFPTIAIADLKSETAGESSRNIIHSILQSPVKSSTGVLAIFSRPEELLASIARLNESIFNNFDYFSPIRLAQAEKLTGRHFSPVRFWTLAGVLLGAASGFALAIWSAKVNSLIVGGKHPVSIIPYCIIAFEGAVLVGSIFNLIGLIIHTRLKFSEMPRYYDGRFSSDRFGLFVGCTREQLKAAEKFLQSGNPEETHVYRT